MRVLSKSTLGTDGLISLMESMHQAGIMICDDWPNDDLQTDVAVDKFLSKVLQGPYWLVGL